ncbi:DUF6480 family protein [Gordonia alkanivorans]|uniref:Uncharacterized protein n=2 Tax=Gordonia alkanivorans TaxID=84096 RepID=F9VTD4_9ACTN|nr:DUF6480 family protein [Gordonia alkanivorans]MDH3020813.1 DUF6480 family protein [Gordonia alkanivorans]MDJ0008036.1 DUF6480 family protein [Gordonia alkanivorans]MDJ0097805.1 DUF6480 family protein [Gordonia alkanivorans]MDJ0493610.1 DUF6480 family protein [Gordonia alkanivorans]GAA11873.1 hypothetical protein GOALK_045_00680 [Gordonia alkanivorans NBRC 16433]
MSDEPRESMDPAPEETPDLEAGGGVAPGDTPPDTPQTSGLSHEQPDRTKRFPAGGVGALLGVGLLVIAMVVIIIGLITMVF